MDIVDWAQLEFDDMLIGMAVAYPIFHFLWSTLSLRPLLQLILGFQKLRLIFFIGSQLLMRQISSGLEALQLLALHYVLLL